MSKFSRAELQEIVKEEYVNKRRLGELSRSIKVSKSYLSAFANNKADWDTAELEEQLRTVLTQEKKLSFRDERRVMAILEILSDCDDSPEVCKRITTEFI